MDQRRLYVLRHAKSSWADPSLGDSDRPLAPRGQRATNALAEHLKGAGLTPGLVLCSSARRAVETLERVWSGLPPDVPVSIEAGLYAASGTELLRRLQQVPDDVASVLVVGHNPGLEDLVRGLAGAAPRQLRMGTKFPTGALATVGFTGTWRDLSWGGATLEDVVLPRQLD